MKKAILVVVMVLAVVAGFVAGRLTAKPDFKAGQKYRVREVVAQGETNAPIPCYVVLDGDKPACIVRVNMNYATGGYLTIYPYDEGLYHFFKGDVGVENE